VRSDRGLREKATLGVAWLRAASLLRRHRVRHGDWPSITGAAPRISNRGTITVGRHFAVRGEQFRCAFGADPGAVLEIGDDVFVNHGATIHATRRITIGSNVRIGDQSAIYDSSYHEVDPGEGVESADVVIGDDVWLARGVVVLPGSEIGEGSVIGAGSVVRGSIPPWVVAAGSPARVVREIRTRGRRR
jgi:maltose O-acetyltransferase